MPFAILVWQGDQRLCFVFRESTAKSAKENEPAVIGFG
ncbi:hypothetical protein RU94_GL000671 [Enterococcus asini]|nr:hypothetical protein RU94_GL000671 [Enterococcus asini]